MYNVSETENAMSTLEQFKLLFKISEYLKVIPKFDLNKREIKKLTTIGVVHLFGLAVFTPIVVVLLIYHMKTVLKMDGSISIILSIAQTLIMFINMNLYYGTVLRKEVFGSYLNCLLKVDDLLVPTKSTKKFFYLEMIIVMCMYLAIWIIMVVGFWQQWILFILSVFVGMINLNAVIISCFIGLHSMLLEDRFKTANRYLRNIGLIENKENLQRCQFAVNLFMLLNEAVEKFNQFFGWSILYVITLCLVNVLGGVNLFLSSDKIQEIQESEAVSISLAECCLWMVYI